MHDRDAGHDGRGEVYFFSRIPQIDDPRLGLGPGVKGQKTHHNSGGSNCWARVDSNSPLEVAGDEAEKIARDLELAPESGCVLTMQSGNAGVPVGLVCELAMFGSIAGNEMFTGISAPIVFAGGDGLLCSADDITMDSVKGKIVVAKRGVCAMSGKVKTHARQILTNVH